MDFWLLRFWRRQSGFYTAAWREKGAAPDAPDAPGARAERKKIRGKTGWFGFPENNKREVFTGLR